MKIHPTRDDGTALLRLEGRLDREGAEQLSGALESLLRLGARSLWVDLSRVTYASSAATEVLARWQQELKLLRGEMQLISVPPAVEETFALVGWAFGSPGRVSGASEFRRSSWHAREDFTASGHYEFSTIDPAGRLSCRRHGHPGQITEGITGVDQCEVVEFPAESFGLGIGAIGAGFDDGRDQMGELLAAGGCIAHFPTGGARLPDYLAGDAESGIPPRALLASGLSCTGSFSHLVRFGPRPDSTAVPLTEMAGVALDAVGSATAGLVIAAETAGLRGVRLLRSPAADGAPLQLSLPAVRDWLLFPPEPLHRLTTTVIVGVVARSPAPELAPLLRSVAGSGRLYTHFHAAVLSYFPLPQRTVALSALLRTLFTTRPLRDVLHLVRDPRATTTAPDSELIRGVAWAGPIQEPG